VYVLNLLVYQKVVVDAMYLNEKFAGGNVREKLRNCWFHVALLVSFSVPVMVLMVLDYLDIESFYVFNQEFRFLSTFKGRMFYVFFLWIALLESIIDWSKVIEKKPKSHLRIVLCFFCAFIPLIYVLSVNFWGLDAMILSFGRDLGFSGYSLNFHWVLCVEYFVFALSFLVAMFLAYKQGGLGFFGMASTVLLGMSIIYAIDTFYPGGSFKPLEMLALPTAACASAILDILGYPFRLSFDTSLVHPVYGTMPAINGIFIGWPCAGVHSLFLFAVIILLLFKRSNITTFRKFVYFVIGGVCTYFVNVLRIVSYFVILWGNGKDNARVFHNTTGELYFFFWILIYILIIVSIEKFMLVEKVRFIIHRKGQK